MKETVLVNPYGIDWRGSIQKKMARDFSRAFYDSQVWKNCRNAYMESVNHLCERCLKNGLLVPAEIVHHKIELSPSNINNPDITLAFENLEAVCRNCHADIHNRTPRRYMIDNNGKVLPKF